MTNRDDTAASAETPVLNQLLARVEELERRLAASQASPQTATASTSSSAASTESAEARTGRRNFLRLAGVAATGLAASAVISDRAAAANGDDIRQGTSTTGTTQTLVTNTTANPGPAASDIAALRGNGGANAVGLFGEANGSVVGVGSSAAGVVGSSDNGYGVVGVSAIGYDIYSGGNGRIGLTTHLTSGSPVGGSYSIGDIFRNGAGDLYACVVGGAAPGTAKFRKLAGPAASGSLHATSIARVWDTRSAVDPALVGMPGNVISNGQTATINLAPFVPVGASAVMLTFSVYQPGAEGILTAYRGDVSFPGAFISCYYANPGPAANTTIVALSPTYTINLRCTQQGGTTIASADIVGYYR